MKKRLTVLTVALVLILAAALPAMSLTVEEELDAYWEKANPIFAQIEALGTRQTEIYQQFGLSLDEDGGDEVLDDAHYEEYVKGLGVLTDEELKKLMDANAGIVKLSDEIDGLTARYTASEDADEQATIDSLIHFKQKQMEDTIKHEILHIVSLHLTRAKELNGSYSRLAINMAMDIVVNKYLDHLPPYATTLEWVNIKYELHLEPYASFEYYAEKLQTVLDLLDEEEEDSETDPEDNDAEAEYDPAKTHDIWEESTEIDAATLAEFTEKAVLASEKGTISADLGSLLSALKNRKGELPWNLFLRQLMGTVESNKKKTVTRRNRRQPDRLDLRGELRSHIAKIAVAFDISASISDEEFLEAMKEVLGIVKNYNHEITVIECDDRIRRVYPVKTMKDLKERPNTRGGTCFTPVFEYANEQDFNLLVYFTDGKGEGKLKVIPAGYRVLWVISGRGDQLSLQESYGVVKKLNSIEVKDNILDQYDVQQGGFSMNHQESSV
jgi:predicted metal-dependent peptidase